MSEREEDEAAVVMRLRDPPSADLTCTLLETEGICMTVPAAPQHEEETP